MRGFRVLGERVPRSSGTRQDSTTAIYSRPATFRIDPKLDGSTKKSRRILGDSTVSERRNPINGDWHWFPVAMVAAPGFGNRIGETSQPISTKAGRRLGSWSTWRLPVSVSIAPDFGLRSPTFYARRENLYHRSRSPDRRDGYRRAGVGRHGRSPSTQAQGVPRRSPLR